MAVRGIKMTKKVKNDHPFYQIWNKQKKGTKTFFCKSIILEQRPSGKKTGNKNFFREKMAKKQPKTL